MRRFLTIFAALFAFVGCSQDDVVIPNAPIEKPTYYASFADAEADSRTYLDENFMLLWHNDDRISLFATTYNEEYAFADATGSNSGAFNAVDKDSYVTGNTISTTYAVYPYNAANAISNSEILTIHFPAEQSYAEDSFGRGANTMVAAAQSSSSKLLPFRNAGGYMMLKLYGENKTVKSIELKGNNEEVISGAATAEAKYGYLPLITMGAEGGKSITLTCENAVELGATEAEATTFWIVVPPITFEEGFTITVTDADGGTYTKSTSKPTTINRNEIKSMSALAPTFTGETENPETPAKPTNNEIWYTSTDGKIVEPYNSTGFGANIISNTYDAEKECWMIKFDGDVTKIGDEAFYQCSSLTSVIMPESVTHIGQDAFSKCIGMQALTLPKNITSFGYTYEACAFCDCTGKLTIDCNIPDSYYDMEDDEYNVFYSADFTEIIVGESVTTLGKNAFRSCSKLESITLGDNITTYGSNIFTGCTNLSKIHGKHASADNRCWVTDGLLRFFAYKDLTAYNIPENVKFIAGYAFYNCSSLQSITIPEGVTSINSYAFYSCTALQSIFVKAETPATLANYAFYNTKNAQFYIPYKSAEAYNVANGWKDLTLVPYDYENGKVYEPKQDAITYDWYTTVTDGVYTIDAPEELVALSKLTNGDAEALAAVGIESAVTFEGMTINLAADIDLSDYCSVLAGNWTPIGTFKGVFNGNNHTISNLYSKTTGGAGLFLSVSGATIKDVTIHGTLISSEAKNVGGIASEASSTLFENCISAVNITTSTTDLFTCVGGVVGYSSNSKYIACQSIGDISDTIDEWEWANYVGGIVGNTKNGGDKFVACMKLSGKVHEEKSQSYSPVGGILGCVHDYSNVSIRSCYTSISIQGREPGHITNMGYYENYNPSADIANCYYSGTPATSKGIGTRNYGGQHKSFDYGTARSTDIAAEIAIMNEGIDEWNTTHPECMCNYKYALDENSQPKFVKQE